MMDNIRNTNENDKAVYLDNLDKIIKTEFSNVNVRNASIQKVKDVCFKRKKEKRVFSNVGFITAVIAIAIVTSAFEMIFNHVDNDKPTSEVVQGKSEIYQQAINYIKEKHYPQAMGLLNMSLDYKDSKDLLDEMRYLINGSYISNGIWAVGAITSDGGVKVAYNGEDINRFTSVKTWKNIKSICAKGGDSVEGLTKEGKIITTSTVTKKDLLNSKNAPANGTAIVVESVANWSSVKSFQTFYPTSAVALTNDGSVFAAYTNYEDGTLKLKGWDDIVSVADGRSYVVGIKADGTVISNNYGYFGTIDTSKWKDIVAISASSSIIGLREDGTVVSTGINENGEGNVSDWTDIIAISTSRFCTLGLKSNGTVVVVGRNTSGQMDVKEWKDIVAIAAGEYFSIGLKADGTMVIAGDCSYSGAKTPDVANLKGLYVPQITTPVKITNSPTAYIATITNSYQSIENNPIPSQDPTPTLNVHFHEKINVSMPEFDFDVQGYKTQDGNHYVAKKIVISSGSKILQEINLPNDKLTGYPSSFSEDYGFVVEDMNFDGYKDIRIIYSMPAGPNVPYLCWLWDKDSKQFIENEDLEKITAPEFDQEKKLIYSFERGSATDHYEYTYQYIKEKLTLIKSIATGYVNDEDPKNTYSIEKQLINGKWILVEIKKIELKE